MSDQFDLYCYQKIGVQLAQVLAAPETSGEIECACAQYLSEQGYAEPDISIIPTTNHF
jgi:hypothetical protein